MCTFRSLPAWKTNIPCQYRWAYVYRLAAYIIQCPREQITCVAANWYFVRWRQLKQNVNLSSFFNWELLIKFHTLAFLRHVFNYFSLKIKDLQKVYFVYAVDNYGNEISHTKHLITQFHVELALFTLGRA
jgi:hypothetical protein